MVFNGIITFSSVFLFLFQGVTSLRDVKLLVEPSTVIKGGTAALICSRDMQGAPLYSVKWYRGNHEFFRYTPNETPDLKVFGLPGIYVDMNRSNGTQVLLRRLELGLSGNFSCEVTADAPYFATQITTKFIDVIALPTLLPVLVTDKDRYQPEEMLRANCTSPPARPAANLTVFINEEPIRASETSLQPFDNGLLTAKVNVEVKVTPELFPGGRLRVACYATLYDVYNQSAKLDFLTPETDPRPERITLGGGTSKCVLNWLLLLLLFFLPMMVMGEDYGLLSGDFLDIPYTYYDEESEDKAIISLVGG
ncbi:uncharacterized protein LOC123869126 isoform X1 [Maniola jurtina]|uniref:uncharacterized protein LOC123869126 isoform X1 n=1 Tax=Maniola jurtina TaxID=191418 RepID=UPI001E68E292|nr:uncharacterized protein LOC123869126 isoform X1 [Maniola jurtina]